MKAPAALTASSDSLVGARRSGRALGVVPHTFAITVRSRSAVSGAIGPVAKEVGAFHPVLGDALLGGRSATVGSAHLAAARDPVPRQVRGVALDEVGSRVLSAAEPPRHSHAGKTTQASWFAASPRRGRGPLRTGRVGRSGRGTRPSRAAAPGPRRRCGSVRRGKG